MPPPSAPSRAYDQVIFGQAQADALAAGAAVQWRGTRNAPKDESRDDLAARNRAALSYG
jgi:hypothetical protein